MNPNGTGYECCGNVNNDDLLDEDSFHGFTVNNNTTRANLNYFRYSPNSDPTNNQLNNILMDRLDEISDDLATYNDRIIRNEKNIVQLKSQIDNVEWKVNNLRYSKKTPQNMVNNVLTENDERLKRARNIIVNKMPEYEFNTPTDEGAKADFYKNLSAFNAEATKEFLKTLNPQLKSPVYSRRLGKYANGITRPVLITMNDSDEIKLIFKNLKNIKSSTRYNKITVRHDLMILLSYKDPN